MGFLQAAAQRAARIAYLLAQFNGQFGQSCFVIAGAALSTRTHQFGNTDALAFGFFAEERFERWRCEKL